MYMCGIFFDRDETLLILHRLTDKPYKSTLRCLANVPAAKLHEDEAKGDFLLLENGQDTGKYYCAVRIIC